MTDFSAFNATSHSIVYLEDDWNNLLDHGLEKGYTFILRKNGVYYEAILGTGSSGAGTIEYGGSASAGAVDGTDGTAVFDACIDHDADGVSIFIPFGDYTMDMDFTGKSKITVQGASWLGTKITGTVTLQNCHSITLDELWLNDGSYANTMVTLIAADGEWIDRIHLNKLFMYHCDVGLDFQTSGDGWINANFFTNLWIEQSNQPQDQSVCTGTDSCGGNSWINIICQGYASSTAGFTFLKGSDNIYSNVQIVDWPGGINRGTVETGAVYTQIIGGNVTRAEFVDNGTVTNVVDSDNPQLQLVSELLLQNNKFITARNNAGDTDVSLLGMDASDQTVISNGEGNVVINAKVGYNTIFNRSPIIPNATGYYQYNLGGTARNILNLNASNSLYLNNNDAEITLNPADASNVHVGSDAGGTKHFQLSFPSASSVGTPLVASNQIIFGVERYNAGRIAFYPTMCFTPQDTANSVADLTITGARTAAAGAVSTYLCVTINGTDYRIPLHATS